MATDCIAGNNTDKRLSGVQKTIVAQRNWNADTEYKFVMVF
jgi:hypothetical protein